jgi:hypothetical protein
VISIPYGVVLSGSVGAGARMGMIGPEEHKVSEEVKEVREGDAEDRSISKTLVR